MDIVEYPEVPESQIALDHIANPPDAARDWTKSCPLCRTLNHLLSRECFKCGWQGAFCNSDASARRDLFDQMPLLAKPTPLRSRWRTLMEWLFFIGDHRYGDPKIEKQQ